MNLIMLSFGVYFIGMITMSQTIKMKNKERLGFQRIGVIFLHIGWFLSINMLDKIKHREFTDK